MAQVPVPADVQQKPVEIGGVGGIEVTIAGNESERVILYFHGGVYVIGSAPQSAWHLTARQGSQCPTPGRSSVYRLDFEFAPFYCPTRSASYRGEHCRRWDVFDDDGWHDSVRGRRPQGHERMLED